MSFNCSFKKPKPIQIVRHWLSDGSLLMTTLYYLVESNSYPKSSRIDEEILKYYLDNYSCTEKKRKGETTWIIGSKKIPNN